LTGGESDTNLRGLMAKDDGQSNAINLGLYPAVGVLLGLAVGYWLGEKFGWGFSGIVGGAIVGLIAGLYMLIREGLRANKK